MRAQTLAAQPRDTLDRSQSQTRSATLSLATQYRNTNSHFGLNTSVAQQHQGPNALGPPCLD
eukprot:15436852-Alexandrium_andersonii.AAC.1